MILKALYDYYQEMSQEGKITRFGIKWEEFSSIIIINENGDYVRTEQGARYQVSGLRSRSSNVVPYILFDQPHYIFPPLLVGKQKDRGEHSSFLKEIDKIVERFPQNVGFKAVQSFYKNREWEKPLQSLEPKGWISFRLSSEIDPNRLIASQEEAIIYGAETLHVQEGLCLITGKRGNIIKTHVPIEIPEKLASNRKNKCTLISFNKEAYCSYGKVQGNNAPISSEASYAFTTTLKALLEKGARTNYWIGQTCLVFWSSQQTPQQKEEPLDIFRSTSGMASDPDEKSSTPENTTCNPRASVKKLQQALSSINQDQDTYIEREYPGRFYILGLMPNNSRLCVKLWMEGTIGEILSNTLQHLDDLNIVGSNGIGDETFAPPRSLKSIIKSTLCIPPGKQDSEVSFPSHIVQGLLESIIKGLPYPIALQNACLERIRHERSKKDAKGRRLSPITEMRVALLKACFNRKHRNNDNIKKLTMALDPTNDTPAYLAGRLFFILEDVQKQAISYDINSSIADRYFSRAAGDPNVVFGELLGKANYHLRKLERSSGKPHFARTEIEAILDLLPQEVISQKESQGAIKHRLDEESLFAIGYYHQRAEYRRRRAENREKNEVEKNQHHTGSRSEE
ncbi:type I-C CRISPR-associated protein Cas8c/Csd1 [Porphyromonas sp.]